MKQFFVFIISFENTLHAISFYKKVHVTKNSSLFDVYFVKFDINWGDLVKFMNFKKIIQSRLAVRGDKKGPNQETGMENRGRLKVLNDTKLVLNDHE